MQFLLGLIIMAVGILLIIKTEFFLSFFGRIVFFEKHFGTEGGSRLGYRLIGLAAFFIGLMIFTGLIEGFLNSVLSPLLRSGG